MPKTNVLAKVKKIDIQNRTMGDDWKQSITLTLGDIELTDANLIAIRKFRPNEEVLVNLATLQLGMEDLPIEQKAALLDQGTDATPAPEPPKVKAALTEDEKYLAASESLAEEDNIEEGEPIEMTFVDDQVDDIDPSSIVQSFSFN